jgi:hypothetical protein
MTITRTTCACMLALSMAVPETAFTRDDPLLQAIVCKADQNLESGECLRRFDRENGVDMHSGVATSRSWNSKK